MFEQTVSLATMFLFLSHGDDINTIAWNGSSPCPPPSHADAMHADVIATAKVVDGAASPRHIALDAALCRSMKKDHLRGVATGKCSLSYFPILHLSYLL